MLFQGIAQLKLKVSKIRPNLFSREISNNKHPNFGIHSKYSIELFDLEKKTIEQNPGAWFAEYETMNVCLFYVCYLLNTKLIYIHFLMLIFLRQNYYTTG